MGKRILVGVVVVAVIALFLYLNFFYEDFPLKVDIPGLTSSSDEGPGGIINCEDDIACFSRAMSNNCESALFVLSYPISTENETHDLTGRIQGPLGEACNVTISDPLSGGTMTCILSGRLMNFVNSFDSLKNYCQGNLLEQILTDLEE